MPAPQLTEHGIEAVRGLLESTDDQLASLAGRQEEELYTLAEGTEAAAEWLTARRLEQVTSLRRDLTERGSEIASRLEAMLDRLEAAEAELRSQLRAMHRVAPDPVGSEGPENDELKERRWRRRWLGILRRAA